MDTNLIVKSEGKDGLGSLGINGRIIVKRTRKD